MYTYVLTFETLDKKNQTDFEVLDQTRKPRSYFFLLPQWGQMGPAVSLVGDWARAPGLQGSRSF